LIPACVFIQTWRRKEGTAVEQKRVHKWSDNEIKKT